MTRYRYFCWAAIALATVVLGACDNSSQQGSAPAAPATSAQTSAPPAPQAAAPEAKQSAPAAGETSGTPAPTQVAEAPAASAATEPAAAGAGEAGTPPTYEVKCPEGATSATQCEVDKDTYIGWRTYQANCFVCHGADGMGTTIAPNLMDRFKDRVDYARFKYVVTNGFTGQVGAMPAWKDNPNVMPNIDNLYRYLKARTDGVLPPGRPKRMQ